METSLYRKQVFTSKDCKQQRLRDSKLAQCICCKRFYLFLCERSAHATRHSYRRHLLLHLDRLSLRENVTLASFQHKGVSDYILCIARL